MNFYFIFILIIIFVILFGHNFYEKFDSNSNTSTNLFYTQLPNVFYTAKFINNTNQINKKIIEDTQVQTLTELSVDSYLNSDIVQKKLSCDSHTNQATCWDDNNCQWNYKIGSPSFCSIAPKWLL